MNPNVHALTQRLDHVVTLADRIDADDELSAQYARYLCVLVSGYVEESIRVLLLDYATSRSNPEVTRFVQLNTKNITNLRPGKLKSVLEMFSPTWPETFDSLVAEETTDALNSVVSNRHLIAHGKNTGLSLGRIKEYYRLLKPMVRTLDDTVIR